MPTGNVNSLQVFYDYRAGIFEREAKKVGKEKQNEKRRAWN
jgi:hypothetical protein